MIKMTPIKNYSVQHLDFFLFVWYKTVFVHDIMRWKATSRSRNFELWRPCGNMYHGEMMSYFCQSSGITSWSRPTAVSWEISECLALKSNSCWFWHSFPWAGWCEHVCTQCSGNLGVLMVASLHIVCFFVLLYQGLDCHQRRAHHQPCLNPL